MYASVISSEFGDTAYEGNMYVQFGWMKEASESNGAQIISPQPSSSTEVSVDIYCKMLHSFSILISARNTFY
ncbi:hypothetical protein H5410_054384 [Solanum commersonii]|uniref:Uncharacterized protein n=1 Tax=Solanum commersonii TaxID=4109 RepID=A0A9J5WF63_SOLCO|nr:hypothetical protein H5410_054384 [Solanum commersonii]